MIGTDSETELDLDSVVDEDESVLVLLDPDRVPAAPWGDA
jgi:hypothetical protein